MEAVPEFNYEVDLNPKPEKVGKVDLNVTFIIPINMAPFLTRSSFSCSLLAKEFTEQEDYPQKEQLHYFLTESGVYIQDAIKLILKFIRLAREVTTSVIYCPSYALLMWLNLDVILLCEETYCMSRPYIDDYRIEEKIQASVDDYEESFLDDFQSEEMIQVSRDEYYEPFFYDSEEAIPASIIEFKFRPASKLRVKSLKKRIYQKNETMISIADRVTIDQSKLEINSIDDDTCTICLENFDSEREVITLPCGHVFDNQCIVSWLGVGHVCPLCRFEFPCEADEFNKRN